MADARAAWGIDLGQSALKALKVRYIESANQLVAEAFDYIPFPKILSQPDAIPEHDPGGGRDHRPERSPQGELPISRRPRRLRWRFGDPPEQPLKAPRGEPMQGPAQDLGLVVSSLALPPPPQWDPRQDGPRAITSKDIGPAAWRQSSHRLEHPGRQRFRDRTHSGELQSHEHVPGRPRVQERRT
jgi:hypothetical protein